MHAPSTHKKPPPASDPHCCTADDCGGGLRNNYFPGKALTLDSYRVEQRYQIERRHLLNRAVHGWGVVYGFKLPEIKVGTSPTHVTIGAGLALDECGRELWQTEETRIAVSDLLARDGYGKPRQSSALPRDKDRRLHKCWVLRAHYAERDVGPVTVTDRCRCEHDEWTYTCETVRYSLTPVKCDDCCAEPECDLDCKCERCCDDTTAVAHGGGEGHGPKPARRGGDCLCKHLTGLKIPADCPTSCAIDEPCGGRVRVDFRHGVTLACVVLVEGAECKAPTVYALDACCSRRFVKRNDLLFDLIRGCDLTRIDAIGWDEFHRRTVCFEDFVAAIRSSDVPEKAKFWVRFSRPVRVDSLVPEAFAMTVLSRVNSGWWKVLRAPILDVWKAAPGPKDPHDHTRLAGLVFDPDWEVLGGTAPRYRIEESRVEIEVRGDLIVDCNGQTLDANTFGDRPAPTGNGTPGGTFLSTFRLTPDRCDDAKQSA